MSPLQRDVVRAFFAREHRFFLTGGGALVGFHLYHRETEDLDFFATQPILADGLQALTAVTAELGATLELTADHPHVKRCVLHRGEASAKVDLVLETVAQAYVHKREIDGITLDPPEEILANKLCTLLSRVELRDLVDVRALESADYSIETAFPLAMRKDGGLTPAQLRDVLNDWHIGGDVPIPGDVPRAELEAYRRELIGRLTRMAFPRSR